MSKNTLVETLSGIRGVWEETLTPDIVAAYAHAYAQIVIKETDNPIVVVGGDARASSKEVRNIFSDTLLAYDCTVVDLGVTTTPIAQFAVRLTKAHGGVMVTASHNPPEFNGLKMFDSTGAMVLPEVSEAIIAQAKVFQTTKPKVSQKKKGTLTNRREEIKQAYVQDVLRIIKPAISAIKQKHFSIVADVNGGPVIEALETLAKELNLNIIPVHNTPGVFGRTIEPTIETLAHLPKIVTKQGASFGCGFDADADRVEIVLPAGSQYAQERGVMVAGNYVLALGVEAMLQMYNINKPIVVNIATSHLIHNLAQKHNVEVAEVDTGEINLVTKMRELDSRIGGEGSNGGIIEGSTTCRDGMVSICLIMALMALTDRTLDQILMTYPQFFEQRIRAQCAGDQVLAVSGKLVDYFTQQGYTVIQPPSTMGGFKVVFDQESMLYFRASATEPGLFRIIANSSDKEQVGHMIGLGEKVFSALST